MDFLWNYILPFLLVLSVLVFVHEWGHFWVARRCGVRVETFSIGFGPELIGRTDRQGTRWKFAAIPLGGYVRFYGDGDAASATRSDVEQDESVDAADKARMFQNKPLAQRAAVVAAGPAANFVFAAIMLAGLFMAYGHPVPAPVVGSVEPDSVAESAGILPGDRILAVDDQEVWRFTDIAFLIADGQGRTITVTLERQGETVAIEATPRLVSLEAADGTLVDRYLLGIRAESGQLGPFRAVTLAVSETVAITFGTLNALGDIIIGERGTEELGGPIRIAQLSGDLAQSGIVMFVWFIAVLSINLGLINLFPIPVLDGGHLVMYAFEAVLRRPLSERVQEYGFRIGLALVLTLMVFATWNDLVQLQVFAFLRDLVS